MLRRCTTLQCDTPPPSLHFYCALGAMEAEPVLTWLQGVLDVEHRGPVAVQHALLHLVFGHVAAAVLYPDARLQVVEVPAVELEELNEQDADVGVGAGDILPVVHLKQQVTRPESTTFKMVSNPNSFVYFVFCVSCFIGKFIKDMNTTYLCRWCITTITSSKQTLACYCSKNEFTKSQG